MEPYLNHGVLLKWVNKQICLAAIIITDSAAAGRFNFAEEAAGGGFGK
jgi:hypothetical protein